MSISSRYAPSVRIGAAWGVGLGLLVCVWTMVVHVAGIYTTRIQFAQIVDIAATILPVICIAGALRRRRHVSPDGRLRFADGIVTGLTVGVASLPLTISFLWYYHHAINPRWLDFLTAHEQQRLIAAAAARDVISAKVAALRASGEDRAQFFGAVVGTTLLSLVLSAFATLVLRITRAPARSQ